MRIRTIMLTVAAAGLVALLGQAPARAEGEAPKDPTRGQWDSFLDPVRDVEDDVTSMQKDFEDYSKIHVGFNFDTFWEWNFNDPSSGFNTLRSLDPDHAQAFVNLAQLRLSRPSEGWFIPGFVVNLDGGRIAKLIKSDWGGTPGVARGDIFEKNSFDAQDVYLTWAAPEDAPEWLKPLSIKGGKFATLLGAEVIEPWANFNMTRSFLYGFAIPITNTGVMAAYTVNDHVSVTGGVVNGWDRVSSSNNHHAWTWMGGAAITVNDQLSFNANGIVGAEQASNVGNKRGVMDLIATYKPIDPLTLQLNYDYGRESGANITGGDALWQGIAGIANYAFTDRASAAMRWEWFEDHGGSRTGTKQGLWEFTLDGKYSITQHLYTRAEYRHDESSKEVFLAGSDKMLSGQDTIGFEFGYLFN